MNLELLRIWRESGKTILFVTHDIVEAVFLGSRCAALTARPARMADSFVIDLPHPRTLAMRSTPEFGAYVARIHTLLGL
jgi:NitT/TauT family transport system ATP-binding protein